MLTPLTESQDKFIAEMFEWCVDQLQANLLSPTINNLEEYRDNLKKARIALALLTGNKSKLSKDAPK